MNAGSIEQSVYIYYLEKKIIILINANTVEPRSTSSPLYEKLALRAAIREHLYIVGRIKIRSRSNSHIHRCF